MLIWWCRRSLTDCVHHQAQESVVDEDATAGLNDLNNVLVVQVDHLGGDLVLQRLIRGQFDFLASREDNVLVGVAGEDARADFRSLGV